MTIQFEAGHTYATPLITDSDAICSIEVLSRTAKTIKALVYGRKEKTLRVVVYEGAEQVLPWGSYSMCPVVGADDECTLMTPAIEADVYAAVAQALAA